jgi:Putative adhesin
MHVPGIPRRVLLPLIIAAVALFLVGATRAAGVLTAHTITHTRVLAATSIIVVDAGIGDIQVVGADRADVRLTTKQRRSMWGGAHIKARGDAAGLDLRDGCDGLPSGIPFVHDACRVSYRLEVPRNAAVRVTTGTGDLRAENLQGHTDLRTATGDMDVTGASGPLRLHDDVGHVHVHGPAREISVQTATGNIEVVDSRAQTIRARSATGDVVLVVSDATYAVDARSDAGENHVVVRLDAASPRKLLAHSDAGDVIVSPGA